MSLPPVEMPTQSRHGDRRVRGNEAFSLTAGSARGLQSMRSMRAAFVREYLIDLSPTQAAIRAGYAIDRAASTAQLLMKMPHVRDAIARSLASRSRRVGVNADRVLDMLGRMSFGDPRAIFNEDGSLKAPSELSDDDAMMIAGVKTRRIVEVNPDTGKMHQAEIQEVKLVDKTSVLSLLMRHLGMLNDRLSIDVHGSLAEQLEAARARREGGEVEMGDDSALTPAQIAELEAEEAKLIDGVAEDITDEELPDPMDGLSDEARALLG